MVSVFWSSGSSAYLLWWSRFCYCWPMLENSWLITIHLFSTLTFFSFQGLIDLLASLPGVIWQNFWPNWTFTISHTHTIYTSWSPRMHTHVLEPVFCCFGKSVDYKSRFDWLSDWIMTKKESLNFTSTRTRKHTHTCSHTLPPLKLAPCLHLCRSLRSSSSPDIATATDSSLLHWPRRRDEHRVICLRFFFLFFCQFFLCPSDNLAVLVPLHCVLCFQKDR